MPENRYDNPHEYWYSGYPYDGYYNPYRQQGPYGSHMMHHHHRHKPEHKHHYRPYGSYPAYHSDNEAWEQNMPVMKEWREHDAKGGYVGQINQMLAYLQPAVQHSLREVEDKGIKHAVQEGSVLGYLMGKGYPFQDAVDIVESGEVGGLFKG